MQKIKHSVLVLIALTLIACSPVKTQITNEYRLSAYSTKHYAASSGKTTLLLTAPEAVAGYQTEAMRYVKKPFGQGTFVKNAWANPPADMLFPLLIHTLQQTNYFYAVATSPYSEGVDYRLDTQLLALTQNFTKKPSVLEFSAKVVLTRVTDNEVLASRIFAYAIPCTQETPYGGVIAANQAAYRFTADTANFVVGHLPKK